MAESQVENFTAPQTSSTLNTANQPSEGAMRPGPSNDVPAHASLRHLPLPLPLSLPASGPHSPSPWDSRRLCFPSSASLNPSMEGETFAWWPSQMFGCSSAPEMVDCWWLAKAGFYILAQSSVNRLMTTNNTLRLHSAFLLRNCECFARVILLIFPTTQWGMKMAKGPSSLLFAESKIKLLVLRLCCKFASQLQLYWGERAGKRSGGGWPCHTTVSPGARTNTLNFFSTKKYWKMIS